MKSLKFVFAMVVALSPSQFAPVMANDGDDAARASGTGATAGTTDGSDVLSTSSGIAARAAAAQGMDMGGTDKGGMSVMPPGVMVGEAGKWMVGYRYIYDRMDGNLVGSRSISEADVLHQFEMSPTDMTMQMHMGSVMYAPTNRLTVMAMVPYMVKAMDHVDHEGERFTEKTNGFGDVELTGLYSLTDPMNARSRILLSFGASAPTGSINQRHMGMRMEYPMQLGSGTFALRPGVVYLGQASPFGWGARFVSTFQLGRNDNNYRLGNRYEASAWVTRLISYTLSATAGINGESRGNIRGLDPLLDALEEPTKDPRRQGGDRLDATLGLAFHPQRGMLSGSSFFLNADLPIHQSLDGPQLKKRFGVRFEFQREF